MIHLHQGQKHAETDDWLTWRCDIVTCPECRETEFFKTAERSQADPSSHYAASLKQPPEVCLFRPILDEDAWVRADGMLVVGDDAEVKIKSLLGTLADTEEGRKMLYEALRAEGDGG